MTGFWNLSELNKIKTSRSFPGSFLLRPPPPVVTGVLIVYHIVQYVLPVMVNGNWVLSACFSNLKRRGSFLMRFYDLFHVTLFFNQDGTLLNMTFISAEFNSEIGGENYVRDNPWKLSLPKYHLWFFKLTTENDLSLISSYVEFTRK